MSKITGKLTTALADRYKIERHLGEGGMATIYLAEDLKHKRKVALKVLRWSHSGRELFYTDGDNELISVRVVPGTPFAVGEQQTLFSAQQYRADVYHQMYDVARDD